MTVTRQTNFKHSPNFKKHKWIMMSADSAVDSYPSVFAFAPHQSSSEPHSKQSKQKKKAKATPPVKMKNKVGKPTQQAKIKSSPPTPPKRSKEEPVLLNATGGILDQFMIDFIQNFNRLNLEPGLVQVLSCYLPTRVRTYLNNEIMNLQKQAFLAKGVKVYFNVETVKDNIITAIKLHVE